VTGRERVLPGRLTRKRPSVTVVRVPDRFARKHHTADDVVGGAVEERLVTAGHLTPSYSRQPKPEPSSDQEAVRRSLIRLAARAASSGSGLPGFFLVTGISEDLSTMPWNSPLSAFSMYRNGPAFRPTPDWSDSTTWVPGAGWKDLGSIASMPTGWKA